MMLMIIIIIIIMIITILAILFIIIDDIDTFILTVVCMKKMTNHTHIIVAVLCVFFPYIFFSTDYTKKRMKKFNQNKILNVSIIHICMGKDFFSVTGAHFRVQAQYSNSLKTKSHYTQCVYGVLTYMQIESHYNHSGYFSLVDEENKMQERKKILVQRLVFCHFFFSLS